MTRSPLHVASCRRVAHVIRTLYCLLMLGLVACSVESTPRKAVQVPLADGGHLATVILGRGADTVLVIPGGPGFGAAYLEPLLAPLSSHRTFILVDLRGRGHSSVAAAPTLEMDLADLDQVRAHFQLARFALVTHHYGALVASAYARRHPGRVARLIALGPFPPRARYQFDLALGKKDSAWQARVVALYSAKAAELDPERFCREAWEVHLAPADRGDQEVMRALRSSICDAPAAALRTRGKIKSGILHSLGDWEWRDTLRAVMVPLLVVAGNRDDVLLHAARTWAYYAPDAGITELEGAALFPWIGREGEVRESIDDFLEGKWPHSTRKPPYDEVRAPGDQSVTDTLPDHALQCENCRDITRRSTRTAR